MPGLKQGFEARSTESLPPADEELGQGVDRSAETSSTPPGHTPPGYDKAVLSEKDSPKDKDRDEVISVHSAMGGSGGDIVYKTMSWQKTSGLLFGEYVCLAILSFPGAFQTLGMAGGILCVIFLGMVTLYTSLWYHKYAMRHPHLLHIADIGKQLFGGYQIAYELTAIALILNNTFLMGLHTLTGAEIINTLAGDHPICTVGASVLILVVCALGTLSRKMDHVASMGMFSAVCMFIAIVLTLAFSGAQGRKPAGYDPSAPVYITAWAPKGTTFVQGFNAMLDILFTWVGQIVYPSFIAEMKRPEDFPKALYAVTIAEMALFLTSGIVVYYYAGQYTSAPAVAVLDPTYKKIAFAFVLPVTIIIGIIYAAVVAKYLFVRIFGRTRHFANHTVLGWAGWIAIVFATWTFGWVIGEAVPFFGTLISLMSALFDGFFGFLFPAFMYFEIRRGSLWRNAGWLGRAETIFNLVLVLCAGVVLGPGTYSSVQAIINGYADGTVGTPFTCTNNGL